MKQKNLLPLLISFALSISSTIQSEINHPVASHSIDERARDAAISELAEKFLIQSFNHLQTLESKLTEIALVVGKIPFENRHSIMNALTENKMIINSLLRNQAQPSLSPKNPIKLLELSLLVTDFCNVFIHYLINQIKNDFRNIKVFDIKKFAETSKKNQTRSRSRRLEPARLDKKLQHTHSSLISLDNVVKNIGLTWYNKIARSVDKYIVTPANKWHVPTILYYGSGLSLCSLYFLWIYGGYVQDNQKFSTFVRNFIKTKLLGNNAGPIADNKWGTRYIQQPTALAEPNQNNEQQTESNIKFQKNSSGGGDLENPIPNNASFLATIERGLKDCLLNIQPIGAMGGAYLYASFSETWKNTIYPKIIEKRNAIWNFLRGGEYLNTYNPGIAEIKPKVSFKDMIGNEDVKALFYSIIQYINDPEQLMRIGATPEKGILLTGPARSGKSFFVECFFGELEIHMQIRGKSGAIKFFNISAAQIAQHGIEVILAHVQTMAPAVIFIDEIHLLGLQDGGNMLLLSNFLTAMQSSMNADPSKVVIVIAATNQPENLAKPLRQNGRFGKEIHFKYPTKNQRLQYIKRELTNMALDLTLFDPEAIADKTDQKTFEDLQRIIRNSMTLSWWLQAPLTQELLEKSIDTELNHILMSDDKKLPHNETRILAVHFAGKALAAINLERHEQLDKVTIYPYLTDTKEEALWQKYYKKDEKDVQQKIEYGCLINKQSHDSINMKQETIIINEAITLLAGFAAEELILGSCGFTCHSNDRERAFKIIENLVFGGLDQQTLPKSVREELKIKTYNLLKKCHTDAMKLLQSHKDTLIALIDELMIKQIMTTKEIQAIIDKVEGKSVEKDICTTIDVQASV